MKTNVLTKDVLNKGLKCLLKNENRNDSDYNELLNKTFGFIIERAFDTYFNHYMKSDCKHMWE